jgi:hypothetical protein
MVLNHFSFFLTNLAPISHNVPAVYDVLPARIRALRSKDQDWQNVAEKNRTKGVARLRFFVARAAEGGEAYTDLLGEVAPYTIIE